MPDGDTGFGFSTDNNAEAITLKLLAYCRANDWAGYDPYDALNSQLIQRLPSLDCRVFRLMLTQALKRSPINVRSFLRVPRTQNPKAIALFVSSLVRLSKAGMPPQSVLVQALIERLKTLRSPDEPYWCWGYSFPWQGRKILVPAGAANLVCTSFVVEALLDVHEQQPEAQLLAMAVSAAEYMLDKLYWTDGAEAGFSYPLPALQVQVHNANVLAAATLCRVYKRTGETKFLAPALQALRASLTKQQPDGSWYYGNAPSQRWIDNFHTGYILCALHSIRRYLLTDEVSPYLQRGLDFYLNHFFREDGAARYFHNCTYPIDIHCVAQSIITLVTLRDRNPDNIPLAESVLQWAINHMWDHRGFFYYRVLRLTTVRTSYMRWSQAWMLLALSTLLAESSHRSRQLDQYAQTPCVDQYAQPLCKE